MLQLNSLLKGRYQVLEHAGRGGMGTVFIAQDLNLNRTVAVKVAHSASSEGLLAFEREAKLLNRLRHPSLPVVIDYFVSDQSYCFVMDYVKGESLATRIRRQGKPLPPEEVRRLGLQLLEVLTYLHGSDPPILHRDIKPDNLKIAANGRLMLLDFGLAKGSADEMSQTPGSVHGFTPEYAPLEQIHGSGTDARTDLYSAGATLFYLATGAAAPTALDRAAGFVSNRQDMLPSPHQLNPLISPSLSEVIVKAMQLNSPDRYQSASEMHDALSRASVQPGVQVSQASPLPPGPVQLPQPASAVFVRRREKRRALWAIPVVVLLIVGVGFLAWKLKLQSGHESTSNQPGRDPDTGELLPLDNPPKFQTEFPIELPDFADKEKRIRVLERIKIGGHVQFMIWDQNQRSLYILDDSQKILYKVDARTRRIVAEVPVPRNTHDLCLSRDNKKLYLDATPPIPSRGGSKKYVGILQVIAADTLKILREFAVPFYPDRIIEAAPDQLYISGGKNGLVVFDVSTMTTVRDDIHVFGAFSLMHEGQRLYAYNARHQGEVDVFLLPFRPGEQYHDYSVWYDWQEHEICGAYTISSDDSYYFCKNGNVFRIGPPNAQEDLRFSASLQPFKELVISSDLTRVVALHRDSKKIYRFEYPSFKLVDTWNPQSLIYNLALEDFTGLVYAAVDEHPQWQTSVDPYGSVWVLKISGE